MPDKLDNVHPLLAAKARKILEIAKGEGFDLRVVQGLRTFAEQDALFRQRPRVTRARGGQSYHNYGLAVDFGFFVNGKYDGNDLSLYKRIEAWATTVGLEWGGNWKSFKDLPHVQLPNAPKTSECLALMKAKGLNTVWLRWK